MPTKTVKKHGTAKNRFQNRRTSKKRATIANNNEGQVAAPKPPQNGYFVWGRHAVFAALSNDQRRVAQIYAASDNSESSLNTHISKQTLDRRSDLPTVQRIDQRRLDNIGSAFDKVVHQGMVAAVWPLDQPHLCDFLATHRNKRLRLLLLDQLSDPRNVGSILRSARAFGVAAVITTSRNAAEEGGALARAACGSLDDLPYLRVPNLARAIETLQKDQIYIAGLTSDGKMTVSDLAEVERLAIVLGAEGSGLRRLSRNHCDQLVRIDIDNHSDSLNVSNAAAIALYAATLRQRS